MVDDIVDFNYFPACQCIEIVKEKNFWARWGSKKLFLYRENLTIPLPGGVFSLYFVFPPE